MRTLALIALATLLTTAAGCVETRTETRTIPTDEALGDDTGARTTQTSPPAPAALPQPPRPVLNR